MLPTVISFNDANWSFFPMDRLTALDLNVFPSLAGGRNAS